MSPTKAGFSPHRRKHSASSATWDALCGSPTRAFAIVFALLLSVGWIINSVHLLQDIGANSNTNTIPNSNAIPNANSAPRSAGGNEPLHKPPVVIHKEEQASPPRAVRVTATKGTWPMQDQFYTSAFPADDTSTTIILNLFKGPAEALRIQLEAALAQQDVAPPEIWVMCFNSPMQREYEAVVAEVRQKLEASELPGPKSKISLTVSDFNHKFHGRFLLAYMATTKYVLILDDDKNIDQTTVRDYIGYIKQRPGVWGNTGHIRAPDFAGYKAWPKHFSANDREAEVDYLSGMWFLEQRWLEYFVKERMPSWETSEDMHLSHVMRKYLNLNTYGGRVALGLQKLPEKKHAATKGSALDLREYIFDHQLGRGNKVANVDQPIDTLVYAETVEDIEDFIGKLATCASLATPSLRESPALVASSAPWCSSGRTAVVFRGAQEQDVVGLIATAEKLCTKTQCEYLSVKPKIKHPIRYFNMREGYGEDGVDIPWQTSASDVLTSFVGILSNIQPKQVFVPDVKDTVWIEADATTPTKQNRLDVFHDTIQLAIKIHRSSPINPKWKHREVLKSEATAYPRGVKVFALRHSTVDAVDQRDLPNAWMQFATEL